MLAGKPHRRRSIASRLSNTAPDHSGVTLFHPGLICTTILSSCRHATNLRAREAIASRWHLPAYSLLEADVVTRERESRLGPARTLRLKVSSSFAHFLLLVAVNRALMQLASL